MSNHNATFKYITALTCVVLLGIVANPICALANTNNQDIVPAPANKKTSIQSMEKSLEQHKEEKAIMDKGLRSLEDEITSNKERLITLSQNIQNIEQSLITLEGKIKANSAERDVLKEKLENDKDTIVQLVLAMDRLQKIPMAALVMRPGAPLETAQSALLIKDIGQSLSARTQRLQNDASRLKDILAELKADKASLDQKNTALQSDKKDLQKFLDKKQKLYQRSKVDVQNKAEIIARITKESKNMRDLISNLEEQRAKEQAAADKKKKEQSLLTRAVTAFTPPLVIKGRDNKTFGPPIAGAVRIKYGQPDFLNAPSKGLWMEGHQNGLVVAPMSGTVRFVGQFKTYGNIVILEHKNSYHSLIAGLERITVDIDHKVSGGEPIGYLGEKSAHSDNPMVYFELRKSGKAIDPTPKLGKLSSN